MIYYIVSVFNLIISIALIVLSLGGDIPTSPFIEGYENEIIMKAYGSVFLILGYGVIPLSVGFFLASLVALVKKYIHPKFIVPTLVTAFATSTGGAYVSPESGGIIGLEIKRILEGLNLPQSFSITIIAVITLVLSFALVFPAFLYTIRKRTSLKRKEEQQDVKDKKTDTHKMSEQKLTNTFNRTEITIKLDETSHATDVISIVEKSNKTLTEHDSSDTKDEQTYDKTHINETAGKKKFELPSPDLLDEPTELSYDPPDVLSKTARDLIQALESFGIKGKIISATSGPVVNFFEFVPETGIRATKIVFLGDDISIAMRTPGIRIVAPAPSSGTVGFEVPRKTRSIVRLKEVFFAADSKKMKIPLTIGKDIYGRPFTIDLHKLPHLLIAGTTGSGKSVLLNTIIVSLLMRFTPDEMKFILVDPKMLEFSPYSGIPNLVTDVITSSKGAIDALRWAVDEMLHRYQTMKKESAKNIDDFVEKTGQNMPRIVVIIDEYADLMVSSARKVEEYVMRLSQMARAAGIHLILTTQRPSADVVTGIIKSNLPARIALRVSDKTNSRVILDTNGAETLLGQGDFLFSMPGVMPQRGHGCYISDKEIARVVEHLKKQQEPNYIQIIAEEDDEASASPDLFEDRDPKFREAVEIAKNFGQISISLLQRKLGIGFNRAARIVEEMEQKGIVKRQDKRLIYVGLPEKKTNNSAN